jgi:hypothetical protein
MEEAGRDAPGFFHVRVSASQFRHANAFPGHDRRQPDERLSMIDVPQCRHEGAPGMHWKNYDICIAGGLR